MCDCSNLNPEDLCEPADLCDCTNFYEPIDLRDLEVQPELCPCDPQNPCFEECKDECPLPEEEVWDCGQGPCKKVKKCGNSEKAKVENQPPPRYPEDGGLPPKVSIPSQQNNAFSDPSEKSNINQLMEDLSPVTETELEDLPPPVTETEVPIVTEQIIPPQATPDQDLIDYNDAYEEDVEIWFSKGCTPGSQEILYQAAQDEIPYEPASYAWDTRVAPMSKIQHDYLWCIEVDFKFNSFFGLNFSPVWVGAVKANSSPVNVIFWAYKLGSPWHQRWLDIVVADPLATNPPNPEPTFYTDKHWNHLFGAKKNSIKHTNAGTLNYDITRHESEPYVDNALYTGIIEKPPITGFKLNGVHSISGLTTEYNKTIQYKAQFTLDETKENTYMWYFRAFRYLPLSIQNTTTGIDLSAIGNSYADNAPPPFDTWSTTDVTEFKSWALSMASTPNKYFTGPQIEYAAATTEIPYQAAVIGTCPVVDPPPPEPPVAGPRQVSPSFTLTAESSEADMLNASTQTSQAVWNNFSQDPDGIGWIPPIQWQEAEWDGIPLDPAGKTNEELCAFIKPTESAYVIKGLREKFYAVNPFADNTNPTPAEIDNWNLEVIRHFRDLIKNPNPLLPDERPVSFDARLFIEARWADERQRTMYWDADYPTNQDPLDPSTWNTYGPCWYLGAPLVNASSGHCGASFFPNTAKITEAVAAPPYNNDFVKYPELSGYTVRRGNAEGKSGIDANTPWSLKLAVVIANFICTEGTTGHASPFLSSRQTMGFSWWYTGGTGMAFRGKYR